MPAEADANLADTIGKSIGRFGESIISLLNGDPGGASVLVQSTVLPAAISVLLIIVSYFVARLLGRWIAAAICSRVDETLGKFLGRCVFYVVMICASLSILARAGVNVAGVAAIFTAAGFAVGLAFQGTLSNFASGILLLVFRPFKVGDTIIAAGVHGTVNEIDLFTTTLDTPDNRRLIVPNGSIAGATIENASYHAHRRVEINVGVAYRCGLDETRQALTQACQTLQEQIVAGEHRGFQVMLANLGPSSVDWTIRAWVASPSAAAVKEQLTVEVKRQLEQTGLEIPFPQMQVHLSQEKVAEEAADSAESNTNSSKLRPRLRASIRDVA